MPNTTLGVGNGQSADSYENYFLVVGERKHNNMPGNECFGGKRGNKKHQ